MQIDKMNDRNITKSKFYVLSESEFMKYLTIGAYYKENHIEVVENFIPTENLNNLQFWMIDPKFKWNYNPSNLDLSSMVCSPSVPLDFLVDCIQGSID